MAHGFRGGGDVETEFSRRWRAPPQLWIMREWNDLIVMRRTDQQEVGQIRPIQSVGSSSRSRGIEDDGPCSRVHGPWTKSRSRIKRLCPVSFLFLFFFLHSIVISPFVSFQSSITIRNNLLQLAQIYLDLPFPSSISFVA